MTNNNESLNIGDSEQYNTPNYIVQKDFGNQAEFHLMKLISESAYDLLRAHGAIVAGGTWTSVFSSSPVNDIDVYFSSKRRTLEFLFDLFDGSYDIFVVKFTQRSIWCVDQCTNTPIQINLIGDQYLSGNATPLAKVEFICDNFDYTICAAGYDLESNTFVAHRDFMKDLAARKLVFMRDTRYPIVSLIRSHKYVNRGYTISPHNLCALSLAIMKIANIIETWEEYADHISGCSGSHNIDIDRLIDKGIPFSIDTALDLIARRNVLSLTEQKPDESEYEVSLFGAIKFVFSKWGWESTQALPMGAVVAYRQHAVTHSPTRWCAVDHHQLVRIINNQSIGYDLSILIIDDPSMTIFDDHQIEQQLPFLLIDLLLFWNVSHLLSS